MIRTSRLVLMVAVMAALLSPCVAAPISATGGPVSATPPTGWADEAIARIAAQEFRFTWRDGVLAAPNRTHDLRTRLSANGFSIVSRTKGEEAFLLELRLTGYGRSDAMSAVEPGVVVEQDGRAELRRRAITETFANDPKGLEHGLTLERPPAEGGSPAVIAFKLGGDVLAFPEGTDGASVMFKDGRGVPVVRYGGLAVKDARGQALSARMVLAPGELRIQIDDSGAVYPLTVDPLATSPQWDVSIQQAGARFGSAVSTAGDVNGDGYSDVIVAAYAYDDGEVDEGKVFVYLGGPSGLSTTAAWTAQSNQTGANFGSAVAAAGDVNGDGYGDVIVGAFMYDNTLTDEGAAFVWFGGPSGLGPDGTPANADWKAFGGQAGAYFGVRVARAGDVNCDNYDDIIVGAHGYDYYDVDDGAAFVYHGGPAGPSTTANWIKSVSNFPGGSAFGLAVAGAGDVNGDGCDDVIVGSPYYQDQNGQEGAVWLYYGSSTGLGNSVWGHVGVQATALLGFSVAGVGDVNGDGYADFVVGTPHSDDAGHVDNGRIDLWLGKSGIPTAASNWSFASGQDFAQLGFSAAAAGDVNGDGFADILAGSDVWNGTFADEGRAWLFLGKSGVPASTPSWTVEGGQNSAYLGDAVSGAGDVNGDGYADVIVGVYGWDDTQGDSGAARVFLGAPAGLKATADSAVTPGQAGAEFGYSVAGAGDVNGDGFSDVIVGAWRYDDGESNEGAAFVYHGGPNGLSTVPAYTIENNLAGASLGFSVASAGDVNGDGYGDVIVGAYASASPGATSGAVFVYAGSASGLTGTRWQVGPSQTGALLGWTVAGAGDVDGDGYGDVVMGAPFWDDVTTDQGATFISYGSSTGPGSAVRFGTAMGTSFARMGLVVAGAGDVNADGYSDVLVGMDTWDGFGGGDHGKVYLFMGSAAGISDTPATWAPEGSAPQTHFGSAVASAGDVNGDGYADVVVGAYGYSNGNSSEGRALVYLGGPSGPQPFPSWSFESDQTSGGLGNGPTSVASAGDVNNDGYSDIIVGASGWTEGTNAIAGKAWVFLGSAAGVSGTPAWSTVGAAAGNSLGFSVALAGDVNGDGYSDVLVGERYNGDGGNTNQGKAYIFYGNGGVGGRAQPCRQANAALTRNVAPLGVVDIDDSVTARHTMALPAGWDSVNLELELKPLAGAPFDGTGTILGPRVSAHGSSSGDVSDFILAPLGVYKWRVRTVKGRSPYFPHSPWFGIADTARTLTDFRTPCRGSYWYQDADGDGHGNPNISAFVCRQFHGYVDIGDDCDDTNAARFPGNPEICDGIDNNCDSIVDNAAVPSGVSLLALAKSGLTANLSWSALATASGYDVTRGSLGTLRSFGGNFTPAVNACLANNTATPATSDTSVPATGDAWWYLVRGENCGGSATYDDPGPWQSGSRDAEIAASTSACP